MKKILDIQNLEASIENTTILKDLNLSIYPNEIHVIMGPNGSGKSTLSKILAGHPAYQINSGTITFCEKNLLDMEPEIRSHEGLFLAFQYPLEISGVTNYDFLRIAYNEKRKYEKQVEVNPLEFMQTIEILLQKLKMKSEFLYRNLNEGFSGGEKKRNEILQMLLLAPKLVILDEIDSGLDIDALKVICEGILQNLPKDVSLLVITHYPKILTYLKPTKVHILMNGKIIQDGNLELIEQLETEGYDSFSKEKKTK
jgi:Fe-S cluster assembly ATP-binding protein